MGLADRLDAVPEPDARRPRQQHPKGFEPGIKFEAGEPSEVTVQLDTVPEDEQAWRAEILRRTGLEIPEDRQVQLTQIRYWNTSPDFECHYCRFVIVDRPDTRPEVDAVALLKALRPRRQPRTAFTGDTTLAVSWNDWQTGKLAAGGTPALAERLDAAFDGVAQRARELRKIGRDLGHLLVVGGGDMVEGCVIFPNQSYEIDTDRRGQIRNTVTFGLDGLDRLAPMFDRVTVLAVGGNHGEHRIDGKRTTRHDNDDCAVFEHMALAAARDSRLQHVNFVIAQDELVKTIDVNGWVFGTTHGQVFGRGNGAVEQRAYKWYAGQAAGHLPAGDCDLLLTHHYHYFAASDWGGCQWVQTPAMDGGSDWWTDISGKHSAPGMLTWAMSAEKRFADAQIL